MAESVKQWNTIFEQSNAHRKLNPFTWRVLQCLNNWIKPTNRQFRHIYMYVYMHTPEYICFCMLTSRQWLYFWMLENVTLHKIEERSCSSFFAFRIDFCKDSFIYGTHIAYEKVNYEPNQARSGYFQFSFRSICLTGITHRPHIFMHSHSHSHIIEHTLIEYNYFLLFA